MLLGNPTPLARPRFSGECSKVYDSQKSIKLCHGLEIAKQHDECHGEGLVLTGRPLRLILNSFLHIPKCSQKRKEILKNSYHFYKPDLSNLVKYVEDICTGVVYSDDCLISEIVASKRYCFEPRTEFRIEVI